MTPNVELLNGLAETTRQLIETLRERNASPEKLKVLKRRWKLTDAAKLISLSDSHLRRLAREGKIPAGEPTKNQRRSFTLTELNEIRHQLEREPHRDSQTDRCFKLAISNFKGGVNKTTIAAHLAQFFALFGYRVLLVDLDPQGSATSLLFRENRIDLEQKDTVYPFLVGHSKTLQAVLAPTAWDNITLIPACLSLYAAEFQLPSLNRQARSFRFWQRLEEGLQTVSDDFDIVVLDTPPALSYLTLNAVWAADGLLVPTQASMLDMQALGSYFEGIYSSLRSIENASGEHKEFAFLRVLITNYRGSSIPEQVTAGWIRKMFAEYVMDSAICNSVAVQTAMAQMRTLYEIEAAEVGNKTYRRALDSFSEAGTELLRLIRFFWPSQRKALKKEETLHG